MKLNGHNLYVFGPYRLDVQRHLLTRDAEPIPLTPKAAELLSLLVSRRGEVVSKDELMETLWPDAHVEEANLTQNVFLLRKALGETAQDRNYIITVPGKGYRFVADVRVIENDAAGRSANIETPMAYPPEEAPRVAQPGRRKWLWIASALAAILVIAAFAIRQWSSARQHTDAGRLIVAVLPFANLTGDPRQDSFIDGLTAEMIVHLGRVDPRRLGVISRTAVMSYKAGQQQVQRIAHDLGVKYVLEGTVRQFSGGVRVTAEMIQVADQTAVWTREYDRDPSRLIELQTEIARDVTAQVEATLGLSRNAAAGAHNVSEPSINSEAKALYLKGRYFWNKRTALGFHRAVEYFEQAIAKDPNFAAAYSGLADSYLLMSTYNIVPAREFIPKARAAAQRALQLEPQQAEGHTSLGLIAEIYDWDWQTADREFRRAIEIDPNYATAHHWYAELLGFEGRYQEALAESERARRLEPLSLIIATDNAAILYYSGQYDRAINELKTVLEVEPFPRAYGLLINSYVEQGKFNDALAIFDHLRTIESDPWLWVIQTYVHGRMGELAKAREALVRMNSVNQQFHWDPIPAMVVAYSGMKDKDQTFAWLEKAFTERSSILATIKADHVFDFARSDPRFQDLLRRVGLPQ